MIIFFQNPLWVQFDVINFCLQHFYKYFTTPLCCASTWIHDRYKCPKCRAPFCCVQCSKDHKSNYCSFATTTDAAKNEIEATITAVTGAANSADEQSKYVPANVLKTYHTHQKRTRRSTIYNDSDSHDDEPGWNITPEMKKRVHQSSWLRKELKDGGLRHLIQTIDAASNDDDDAEEDHDKAVKNSGGKIIGGSHFGKDRKRKRSNANKNTITISPRELALARATYSHPKFASFIDHLLLTAGVLVPAEDMSCKRSKLEGEEVTFPPIGQLILAPVPRHSGALLSTDTPDGSGSSSSESSHDSEESDASSSSDDSGKSNDTEGDNCKGCDDTKSGSGID